MRSTLTLATMLFDLGRRSSGPSRRTIAELLAHGERVFSLPYPLVIFTEEHLVDQVAQACARRSAFTRVDPLEFPGGLPGPAWFERIPALQLPGNRDPQKDTADLLAMGWAKPGLLARVAEENPADTSHVAWIDLGIAHAGVFDWEGWEGAFTDLPDRMRFHRLRYLDQRVTGAKDYYHFVRGTVASGFMAGPREAAAPFADAFAEELECAFAAGRAPLDEDVIGRLVTLTPDRYAASYGDYSHLLCNANGFRGGTTNLSWQIRDAYLRGAPDYAAMILDGMVTAREPTGFTRAPVPTRRLLCLHMIVKNEAERIRETLESVRPWIDAWSITDTGSTDGTQAIILDVLSGVPGELHEMPIVTYRETGAIDYAATRNRALESISFNATWLLLLNGDDVFEDGAALREFCRDATDPGYGVTIKGYQEGDFTSLRLVQLRNGWRYKMPTHEILGPGWAPETAPGAILHHGEPREKSIGRWERDARVLEGWTAIHATDFRGWYYLAQTYACLGRDLAAQTAYRYAANLPGGGRDGVFEALRRAAGLAERSGSPWSDVLAIYLAAHAANPTRLEPLCAVAEHYHAEDNHALAYLFARPVLDGRPPEGPYQDFGAPGRMADLVAIHAYYLGQLEDGRRAARTVAEAAPSPRARRNYHYYSRRLLDAPGALGREITLDLDPGWAPCNPSIVVSGGRRVGVVRTVNYQIQPNGAYQWTDQSGVIRTRNWFVEFDADWGVTEAFELVDPWPAQGQIQGLEDCRLFPWQGGLWASATVADMSPDGRREVVLAGVQPTQRTILRCEVLRGPWSSGHQKNWKPYVRSGDLGWIYSTAPLQTWEYGAPLVGFAPCGDLLGSSQAIQIPTGEWLWVDHEVAPISPRVYAHRFVLADAELSRVIGVSEPWCFQAPQIEFCAGLALDEGRVVLSYGVRDRQAFTVALPLAHVLTMIGG